MTNKITYRLCQSCRNLTDRKKMIKITKLQNGKLKINPDTKELGRSVYVCKNIECVNLLIKKKKLKAALKYNDLEEIKKIENELLNILEQ